MDYGGFHLFFSYIFFVSRIDPDIYVFFVL